MPRMHSGPSPADPAAIDKLRHRMLDDLRRGALEFPPLPQVALELGKLAYTPDPDIDEALKLVERDGQLAGRVLKAASSPAFGGRPSASLGEAVMRLGVNGLRDLAYAASMGRVFRCEVLQDQVRAEVQHGFVVAIAGTKAASMLGLPTTSAFLCGLLHDIGKSAVLMAIARYAIEVRTPPEAAFAQAAAATLHSDIGPRVLEAWNVHPDVGVVAGTLHDPERAGDLAPLVRAIAAADAADRIPAETLGERCDTFLARSEGFDAGLSEKQAATLAEVVHDAREDAILTVLTD